VEYSWARVDQLTDGAEARANLTQNVASARPFGKGEKHVVVEASESRPGEQHLALCDIRVTKDVAGPPENCVTVAIISSNVTLFRSRLVLDNFNSSCNSSATFRLDGSTIDIVFDVATRLDPSAFVNPLSRLLNEDLGFSTVLESTKDKDGRITSIYFQSSAGLRGSMILSQEWRESLNFDLWVSRSDTGVSVRGTTRPLVNRLASAHQVEYNPPNDAQRAAYARAFNTKIHDAIARACTSITQVDDRNIVCR
jgi:hypothetical protein